MRFGDGLDTLFVLVKLQPFRYEGLPVMSVEGTTELSQLETYTENGHVLPDVFKRRLQVILCSKLQ